MRICTVFAVMMLLPLPSEAASLTGAIVFGTDASGNYQPDLTIGGIPRNNAWNTVGGDIPYNLYLTLNGVELNTGNGPETSINVPLDIGKTYEVSFALEQPFAETFGLNLFFDGNAANPGISASGGYFTPMGPPPFSPAPFTENAAPFTADLFASFTPGAGTTVYRSGGVRVDLSVLDFLPTAGEYASPYSRTPGGNGPDAVGAFVLVVTADVPELQLAHCFLPFFCVTEPRPRGSGFLDAYRAATARERFFLMSDNLEKHAAVVLPGEHRKQFARPYAELSAWKPHGRSSTTYQRTWAMQELRIRSLETATTSA